MKVIYEFDLDKENASDNKELFLFQNANNMLMIISDIYAARETDTLGVSSEKLANAIGERAIYMKTFDEIAAYLAKEAKDGDLILTMGAGDVYKIANLLKEALEK